MNAATVEKIKNPKIIYFNHVGNFKILSPCAYECNPPKTKFTPKKVKRIAEKPHKLAILKVNLLFNPGM
jgi:hypothetical protein